MISVILFLLDNKLQLRKVQIYSVNYYLFEKEGNKNIDKT